MRPIVLAEEPWCPDPFSIHGRNRIPTTEVDHIRPIARGGRSERRNLRALCRSCNRRKALDDRRSWRDE